MILNLNSEVTFRLTEDGAKRYNEWRSAEGFGEFIIKRSAGDGLRMTMWEMASIFGPALYQGGKTLIADNQINVSVPR